MPGQYRRIDAVVALTLAALIVGWLVFYSVLLVKYGEPQHDLPLSAQKE